MDIHLCLVLRREIDTTPTCLVNHKSVKQIYNLQRIILIYIVFYDVVIIPIDVYDGLMQGEDTEQ